MARLNQSIIILLALIISGCFSIRCFDCVGMDCMGSFCDGDYCVISQYAPRWGAIRWGQPEVVKGCAKGSMIDKDVRSHCEFAEDSDEPFTCFCNGRDLCNSRKYVRKMEREEVELVQCVCNGAHCKNDKTCLGELCTYVVNHKTKEVEQGCTNASVPLIERRAIGSCMAPPITGAMHHNVAKDAPSLLAVESCICASDYCNSEKPEPKVPEQKCRAYVETTTMGSTTRSKNITCRGEYCFTASIKSKIGGMQSYETYGCASFTGDDELAEEMEPNGCAVFSSENLEVRTCYKTDSKQAIGRALASKQIREPKRKNRKPIKAEPKKMEIEEEEEESEEEKGIEEKSEEIIEKEEEKEEEEKEVEEKKETGEKKQNDYIFEKPKEAPIPDESNATMITVFILLILCILGSGIVIKFELHKKLKRSSYDTVAGG